ncbi:hypothetical protein [Intrasporangium chromatireducens]|uniref:hypothetical protein n=1 Tax=Intrasporangium chromatireducens TaxID=1386088 RepID=UPI001969C5C5|nr:hypothetical protein [Intrasporangium chromatireducens]
MTAPRSGRGHRHRSPAIALVVASALLVTSVVMALVGVFGPAPWRPTTAGSGVAGGWAGPWGDGSGRMMGGQATGQMWAGHGGMMSGQVWLPGNG